MLKICSKLIAAMHEHFTYYFKTNRLYGLREYIHSMNFVCIMLITFSCCFYIRFSIHKQTRVAVVASSNLTKQNFSFWRNEFVHKFINFVLLLNVRVYRDFQCTRAYKTYAEFCDIPPINTTVEYIR